ncbi:MAG: DUF1178 family protein [Burkholderiaceae bacterium]|nr:MAG: DUF1178 family protein [Burkholderiaceae bacterium]
MKVLDLHCPGGHAFEGWFASEDDFQTQLGRSLVQCPLCGSHEIRKALSAPRLNLGAQPASPLDTQQPKAPAHGDRAAQAAWLRMARKIMTETEDVGPRFAQEARRMHHGEVEERAIRGQSSVKETLQLLEEGIAVLPLPLPEAAKETLQ